jgi:hypothetical protein
MSTNTEVKCPQCGCNINIEEIIEAGTKDALNKKMEEEKKKYISELKKITDEKELLKEKAQEQQDTINKQLEVEKKKYNSELKKMIEEKEALQEKMQEQQDAIRKQISEEYKINFKKQEELLKISIKAELDAEQAESKAILEEELKAKSEQIKEFNKTKAENERLKREKNEMKETMEAESEKKLNELLTEERNKIQMSLDEKHEFKIRELEKKLEDQKILTEEMKRKQDQGSMQLQGEVQELAIEEWLMNKFPIDEITEIKKGERGADCIQIVHTREKFNCGIIAYESKRAKDFSNDWIPKFKKDMLDKKADIGILVTSSFPKEMERMGLQDGIWICSYEEFKGLCYVLRESLIKISYAISSQENSQEKMVLLYNYLTSNEFKSQVEGIIDAFTTLKSDLEAEKKSITRLWAKREKQLEAVLGNTTCMYGAITGIAGKDIPTIKTLELPLLEKNS